MKMYRENFGFNNFNIKKILIVFSAYIFFFVFFLSVGFSAFQTSLVMQDISAAIKYDTDVRISGFRVESIENNAIASNYDYNYNKVYGDILLPEANSSITYAVDVTNLGNTKVGVANITGLSNNFEYTLTGYTIGTPINEDGAYTLGISMTFYITIEYAAGATLSSEVEPFNLDFEFRPFHKLTYQGVPGQENFPQEIMDGFNLVLTTELYSIERLKVTQDTVFLTYGEHYFYDETINQLTVKNITGDLLLSYRDTAYLANLSSDTAFYKDPLYKTKIKNIEFVDYIDLTDAIENWDLSESKNESIVGWVTDNSADQVGTYNLYIGSIYDIYTKDFEKAFANMIGVRNINFNNLNTSESISFNYTFYETDIEYLNLETFNTSSATTMVDMFAGMDKLQSLDVSNFDTSNVTNMWYMFGGLIELRTLDISTFNTSSATNMAHMFSGMTRLRTLVLGENFNTSRVTNMESMFNGCNALESLNLSGFKTNSLKNTKNMFYQCDTLTTLDLTSFNTINVTDMSYMFYGMDNLQSINLSSFDTSNVNTMRAMFASCTSLTSLDLSNFNTSNVTTMTEMFEGASGLKSLDLSSFNTSSVTKMDSMFASCTGLTDLNVKSFDISNVTTMEKMFFHLKSLQKLDLSSFKLKKSCSMYDFLSGCPELTEIDLRQFDFTKVSGSSGIFAETSVTITIIVADDAAKTWVQNVLGEGIGNVIIYEASSENTVTESSSNTGTDTSEGTT